jgi:hypothetical protein
MENIAVQGKPVRRLIFQYFVLIDTLKVNTTFLTPLPSEANKLGTLGLVVKADEPEEQNKQEKPKDLARAEPERPQDLGKPEDQQQTMEQNAEGHQSAAQKKGRGQRRCGNTQVAPTRYSKRNKKASSKQSQLDGEVIEKANTVELEKAKSKRKGAMSQP